MSELKNQETKEKSLQKNAFRFSITMAISMTIVTAYLLISSGLPKELLDLSTLVILEMITSWISTWFSLRGWPTLGIILLIASLLFACVITAIEFSGFGPVLAILALIISFGAGSIALPRKYANPVNIISFVLALAFILLDVFDPFPRQPNTLPTLTWLIAGALVVVFGLSILRNFSSYTFRTKLVISFITVAMLTTGAIAAFTINQTSNALRTNAFEKLKAVEAIKVSELANYFDERKDDMQVLVQIASSLREEGIKKQTAITGLKASELISLFRHWDAEVQNMAANPSVVTGMSDLVSGFKALGASKVRSLYQGKGGTTNARDGSDYSAAHQDLHTLFTRHIEAQGFVDAYLIDSSGNVVYSVRKGQSFGANLTAADYKDSNLTRLYQELKSAEAGQTYLADVQLFDDEKALFIGSPIYQNRVLLGVLAYQLPLSETNAIVQNRSGLGETSETYLVAKVGDHNELRSDRVVKAGNYIGDPKPGEDADQALAGVSGEVFKVGSSGAYEISVFQPLPIETPGVNWAILTTMSVAEMMAPQVEGAESDMLATLKETYGYYDVFLISPDGYIFYTVAHEPDYQTNILTGPYKDTNLASLVTDVLQSKPPVQIVDFAPYAPSQDAPAGFFAAPVFYQGKVVLVVAAQISLEQINAIMSERSGLGESGETYVVGQDNLMRNDSRFLDQLGVETTVLNQTWPVDTAATRSALAGGFGAEVIADYRGTSVLSAWSPLTLRAPDASYPEGITWAFMAEIDEEEALAPVEAQTRTILLLALVITGFSVAAAFGLAQTLANPITRLIHTAEEITAGNLSVRAEITTQDEVGALATTFNEMTTRLSDTLEGLEQQVADRTRALETSTEVSRRLSTILDQEQLVREVVEQLTSAFDYYHAHIYIYDENKRNLVMAGGTGDAGRTMLDSGHKIEAGQGLVGRAAQTNQVVLIPDVAQAEDWLPNPLLPDTKAEVAVPIAIGDDVIGVLDVQHNVTNGLSESDAALIQSIANQVAVVVRNAQDYQQAQYQAIRETQVSAITQQIQTAATIEDVLKIAVSELGQALGAERADIELSMVQKSNGGSSAS